MKKWQNGMLMNWPLSKGVVPQLLRPRKHLPATVVQLRRPRPPPQPLLETVTTLHLQQKQLPSNARSRKRSQRPKEDGCVRCQCRRPRRGASLHSGRVGCGAQERKEKAEAEREARIAAEMENAVDERQVEIDAIEAQLGDEGLHIAKITADGHCLYRSIARQMDLAGEPVGSGVSAVACAHGPQGLNLCDDAVCRTECNNCATLWPSTSGPILMSTPCGWSSTPLMALTPT